MSRAPHPRLERLYKLGAVPSDRLAAWRASPPRLAADEAFVDGFAAADERLDSLLAAPDPGQVCASALARIEAGGAIPPHRLGGSGPAARAANPQTAARRAETAVAQQIAAAARAEADNAARPTSPSEPGPPGRSAAPPWPTAATRRGDPQPSGPQPSGPRPEEARRPFAIAAAEAGSRSRRGALAASAAGGAEPPAATGAGIAFGPGRLSRAQAFDAQSRASAAIAPAASPAARAIAPDLISAGDAALRLAQRSAIAGSSTAWTAPVADHRPRPEPQAVAGTLVGGGPVAGAGDAGGAPRAPITAARSAKPQAQPSAVPPAMPPAVPTGGLRGRSQPLTLPASSLSGADQPDPGSGGLARLAASAALQQPSAAASNADLARAVPSASRIEGPPIAAARVGGFRGLAALGRLEASPQDPATNPPPPTAPDPQTLIAQIEEALREQAERSGIPLPGGPAWR